jgi:hypothetical protein
VLPTITRNKNIGKDISNDNTGSTNTSFGFIFPSQLLKAGMRISEIANPVIKIGSSVMVYHLAILFIKYSLIYLYYTYAERILK